MRVPALPGTPDVAPSLEAVGVFHSCCPLTGKAICCCVDGTPPGLRSPAAAAAFSRMARSLASVWEGRRQPGLGLPDEFVDVPVPRLVKETRTVITPVPIEASVVQPVAKAEARVAKLETRARQAVQRAARLCAASGFDYVPPEGVAIEGSVPPRADHSQLERDAAAALQRRESGEAGGRAQGHGAAHRARTASTAAASPSSAPAAASSPAAAAARAAAPPPAAAAAAQAAAPPPPAAPPAATDGAPSPLSPATSLAAEAAAPRSPQAVGRLPQPRASTASPSKSAETAAAVEVTPAGQLSPAELERLTGEPVSTRPAPATPVGFPIGYTPVGARTAQPPRSWTLRARDIRAELAGRLVQLHWPDDGQWWPARVRSVDASSKKCDLIYENGDEETGSDLGGLVARGEIAWLMGPEGDRRLLAAEARQLAAAGAPAGGLAAGFAASAAAAPGGQPRPSPRQRATPASPRSPSVSRMSPSAGLAAATAARSPPAKRARSDAPASSPMDGAGAAAALRANGSLPLPAAGGAASAALGNGVPRTASAPGVPLGGVGSGPLGIPGVPLAGSGSFSLPLASSGSLGLPLAGSGPLGAQGVPLAPGAMAPPMQMPPGSPSLLPGQLADPALARAESFSGAPMVPRTASATVPAAPAAPVARTASATAALGPRPAAGPPASLNPRTGHPPSASQFGELLMRGDECIGHRALLHVAGRWHGCTVTRVDPVQRVAEVSMVGRIAVLRPEDDGIRWFLRLQ